MFLNQKIEMLFTAENVTEVLTKHLFGLRFYQIFSIILSKRYLKTKTVEEKC